MDSYTYAPPPQQQQPSQQTMYGQPMPQAAPVQQPVYPAQQQQPPVQQQYAAPVQPVPAPAPATAPPPAPVQQKNVLDDLLDFGNDKPAQTASAPPPPPPDYPPPAPMNHDPFGVAQAPPAAPAQPASTSAPVPAQQPQQPVYQAPPPQQAPAPAAPPAAPVQQPYSYPTQQPQQPAVAPTPAQPAPLAQQPPAPAPQQQAPAAPAQPYAYVAPSAQQPNPQPDAPAQQPPHVWYPPSAVNPQHQAAAQPVAQPQPQQPAFNPGFETSAVARPGYPAPVQQPQPGAMPPTGYPAAAGAPGAPVGANEDADRAHLEQIIKLRKELEREQEKEKEKQEEKQTWACVQCTYRNKLGNFECEICGAKRPGYSKTKESAAPQQPQPSAYEQPLPPQQQQAPPQAPPPQQAPPSNEWACPSCTFHNPMSAPKCSMCDAPNPNPARPAPVVQARPVAPRPSAPPSAPAGGESGGGWPCPTCTFDNKLSSTKCTMCGTAMPKEFQEQARAVLQQMQIMQGGAPGGATSAQQYPAGMRGGRTPPTTRPEPTANRNTGNNDEEAVQWQDDNVVTNCNKCNAKFTMMVRRHHCRACGFVFCSTCSSNKAKVKPGGGEERVCIDCYREKLSNPVH